ncbi:MAG: hypothetical protein JNL98_23505 [Bryobacterales bacterium]|nr:hypothetical protein [Bryobacterales bacterium]
MHSIVPTRRNAVQWFLAAMLPPGSQAAASSSAISLNEDANHFFATRADRRVTEKDLTDWVDQYAGTQVRELILNVNAMRTAFASKVWTPFWKDYDPNGPDDQPLFASAPERAFARKWVHTAWQMQQDGLDHFKIWLRRARQKGLSAWLSIRMNDLHNVDDEKHYLHSDFWKQNPQLRRVPHRGEMRDKALDFGRQEVRDYTFRLIEEVAQRYDFDGLELDWMRHGYHFAPGQEAEGREHLNALMFRVRKLLGRARKIGVRVPPHPESALRMGMDAVTWARNGCADLVVPTNFWRTADTAMPLRLWRQLLPAGCLLGAGLELGLNAFPGSVMRNGRPFGYNDLKTVRGASAAYLEQGADRIYLFNYMDSQTAIEDLSEYPVLLREVGRLETLQGKSRRHVVSYTDTWAPGEPVRALLPAAMAAGSWRAFRLATGKVANGLRPLVRLGVDAAPEGWTVRVNNAVATAIGPQQPDDPWPRTAVYGYQVAVEAMRDSETVIEVTAKSAGTVEWVELAWT